MQPTLLNGCTIHHFVRQHLKMASDRRKSRYDRLANSAGFQEGERVWLYRPTRKKGTSLNMQPRWEGPYNVFTRINDVVYRIQRHHRANIMVVHLNRVVQYLGATRDEQPWGGSGNVMNKPVYRWFLWGCFTYTTVTTVIQLFVISQYGFIVHGCCRPNTLIKFS
jgi:hypothetical protein